MKNPPYIFISYSSQDRSLVEKIHLALEAAGFKVWREQTRLEIHTGVGPAGRGKLLSPWRMAMLSV